MLADLGFSIRLVEHLCDHDPLSALGYRCQLPLNYLSSPLSQKSIIALWECGTTITYFNRETHRFEQCDLEGIENLYFSLRTSQAVLADLFIALYEDDHSMDELRVVAKLIDFQHLESLLINVNHESGESQSYEAWRRNFLASCGG